MSRGDYFFRRRVAFPSKAWPQRERNAVTNACSAAGSTARGASASASLIATADLASVSLNRDISPRTLLRALNAHLPPAVRVLDATAVDAAFHARFDAKSKLYRYQIWNGTAVPPMLTKLLPVPALGPGPAIPIRRARPSRPRLERCDESACADLHQNASVYRISDEWGESTAWVQRPISWGVPAPS